MDKTCRKSCHPRRARNDRTDHQDLQDLFSGCQMDSPDLWQADVLMESKRSYSNFLEYIILFANIQLPENERTTNKQKR